MAVSKHYTTMGNKCDRMETAIYDFYSMCKSFKVSFTEFLELKTRKVHDNPDQKGLTPYYKGYLRGVDDALFKRLQKEWVEWKLYYTNKRGNVIYVSKWQQLPKYIQKGGNFNGNHFWNGTIKPFGNNPSKGVGNE